MDANKIMRRKTVAIRKSRPCNGCGKVLKKGAVVDTFAISVPDSAKRINVPKNITICPTCTAYLNKFNEDIRLLGEDGLLYRREKYIWDRMFRDVLTEEEREFYENT